MSALIIGYEGTDQGNDALTLGRMLTEVLSARPVVVSVATWPAYLLSEEQVDAAINAEIEPLLEPVADRLPGLNPDVRVIRNRSVAAGLTELAADEDAIAIVIGSSHHGAIGRVALGSVGTSLVHGSPCSIAVAPRGLGAEDGQHLVRIAVAFDGSPEAWSALDTGIGIAERTHARLAVLTAAEHPAYGLGTAWSAVSAEELTSAEQLDKQRILDLAIGRVPEHLPVDARLLTGPAGTLLAEASSDFDLMVVGSRSHGAIGRTFLGGVANHLIHAAECAVLVLPRGVGSDPFRLEPARSGGARERS